MKEDISSFFSDLKKLVVEYIETRLQLTKINAYEKLAKIIAAIFSGMVIMGLVFFFIFFMSMMGGFYLAQVTGSSFKGFGIIAAAYLLLITLIILFRKKIFQEYVTNAIIKILFDKEYEQ